MTICSVVLIQYQRVTDRRTDGQTDIEILYKTCISMADAHKNVYTWMISYSIIHFYARWQHNKLIIYRLNTIKAAKTYNTMT